MNERREPLAQRMAAAIARWLRPADTLERLDERTLVDIGLRRGEIASVEAEAAGRAPATRRRIVAGPQV